MKPRNSYPNDIPEPPWRKIAFTLLMTGICLGLISSYRTPAAHDAPDDPLYEVFSFSGAGLSNPSELAKRKAEALQPPTGSPAVVDSSSHRGSGGRIPSRKELDRVIDWLLGSKDEIVRTAAGHLRAHSHGQGCDTRQNGGVAWSRDLGVRDIAICTIVRNEAERLPEWIAFHWLQGVGKFYIYDDGSTDEPVERSLRWLMDLGIVDYQRISDTDPFLGTEELQWIKMNDCLSRLHGVKEEEQIRFATFLDVDEFMYPAQPRHASLTRLLNGPAWHDHPCLYVERTYYGTSLRHRRPPQGSLVISSYVMRSPLHEDGYPKVIVNLSPHLPLHVKSLYSVHAITSGEGEEGSGLSCAEQVGEQVRLNHYSRSLEDYDLKIKTHYDGEGRYAKDPLELFWERDRNEEFDDSAAVRYACRVRALVDQLAAAHSHAAGGGGGEEEEARR